MSSRQFLFGLRHAVVDALFVALPVLASAQSSAAVAPASGPVAGAVTTASGLVYKSLREGSGKSPSATDTVKVHYRGTFPDGKEFDSSYSRGEPATFPLDHVIKCWTEGVQRMKVGGKAQLICPAPIAYGERGAGSGLIPPNATLYFEVELLAINPH
jgi:FKBP-type peptidyl-prolyl cis-trans isomerase FkpA